MTTDQFKRLIITHQPAMQRMAAAMLRDDDLAEDAVQEAMISLWRHKDNLERQVSIEGYCITTVKHSCIDLMRKQHPTQPIDRETLMLQDLPPDDLEERYQQAMDVIERLPELQRKAILLRYKEEKSTEEITKELHISSANLYTTISRALQNIKTILKK